MYYKTIIISDVHMGIPDSKYQELLLWLQKQKCSQLILNGDIVDGVYIRLFGKRKKSYTNWFASVKQLAKENNSTLKYIKGNHDDFTKHPMEGEMYDNIIYRSKDKTYYICHGHEFGEVAGKNKLVLFIVFSGVCLFYWINRIYNKTRNRLGLDQHSLIKLAKGIASKIMVGGTKNFHKKLIQTMKKEKVDGIICGHLHESNDILIGKYHYLNSGDRIESCTAVVEHEDGKRELIRISK